MVGIKFEEPASLPEWKGNFIRGVLAKHVRDISCSRKRQDCKLCRMRSNCVYYALFEASAPANARYLSKLEGIPRPIVISETGMDKSAYECGETASFGIVLVGSGLKGLPVIVGALQNLGECGMSIGGHRGKFVLERVQARGLDENNLNVFEDGKLNLDFPRLRFEDFLVKVENYSGKLCLNFLTPTQIKAEGTVETPPKFRNLLARLAFRVNALANYYTGKLEIAEGKIKQMLRASENVRIGSTEIKILPEFLRVSHNKVTRHHMFFMGKIWYEGEFSRDVMALLRFGSLLHVGKYAGFGCGEYLLEQEPVQL